MGIFSRWRTKLNRPGNPGPPAPPGHPYPPGHEKTAHPAGANPCLTIQDDSVELTLPMLTVSLTRRLNTRVPYEVSVIVPRAEIRYREKETEIIYSSITVVHTPRLPPGGKGRVEYSAGEQLITDGEKKIPVIKFIYR
ncbi:MAG: hypothetical protein K6T65_12880 [Peptococcaceae bacterium]|nr:hypothetical protein [Peptococcaceae bacterium]